MELKLSQSTTDLLDLFRNTPTVLDMQTGDPVLNKATENAYLVGALSVVVDMLTTACPEAEERLQLYMKNYHFNSNYR